MITTLFSLNDTAPTEIYTLSLHDALPIFMIAMLALACTSRAAPMPRFFENGDARLAFTLEDRKSTRLNSSHTVISYAVFCLKKKINHTLDHLVRDHSLYPVLLFLRVFLFV